MAGITIAEIKLHRIEVPLKSPFSTHLQSVEKRESILVEMISIDGKVGLGECVAFSSPWYTEETVQTCWDALVKWLIPLVTQKHFNHPAELATVFSPIKGNRMAKSSLDLAAWDLYAKCSDVPLWKLIGGVEDKVDAGIVLTGAIDDKMFEAVEAAARIGYKRVKFKIDQQMKPKDLEQLTTTYKDMLFFADANGLFNELGLDALLAFDQAGLALIEQPFGEDDWYLHQKASAFMNTPIALDESIRSSQDAQQMIKEQAASIIVLKPGRVGGITESLNIIQLAEKHNIPLWIGGMIEFGISKAHNLALASLAQFSLPGDFSASSHFWHEDPVKPEVFITDGFIQLSNDAGLGVQLNKEILVKYRVDAYSTKDSSTS